MSNEVVYIGGWRIERAANVAERGPIRRRLEPKTIDLLFCLAAEPGKVFSRDELLKLLWPDMEVGYDALARCVSKLRKALDDDPKSPQIIETVSKRGYRLTAAQEAGNPAAEPFGCAAVQKRNGPVRLLLGAGAVTLAVAALFIFAQKNPAEFSSEARVLVERADDYYFQYTRQDNESAIELYERAIASDPDFAPGQAGLANALVQRIIRWPRPAGQPEIGRTNLREALESGRTATPQALQQLDRAQALAERAVRLDPRDAETHKALGFVHSARGKFDAATTSYLRAIEIDGNAWGPMINIADILEITGRPAEAVSYLEMAYEAMTRVYDRQAIRVRPWYAELGVYIGDRQRLLNRPQEAEIWYRRVLSYAPFDKRASIGLATLLKNSGDEPGARHLCAELIARTGPAEDCEGILE